MESQSKATVIEAWDEGRLWMGIKENFAAIDLFYVLTVIVGVRLYSFVKSQYFTLKKGRVTIITLKSELNKPDKNNHTLIDIDIK